MRLHYTLSATAVEERKSFIGFVSSFPFALSLSLSLSLYSLLPVFAATVVKRL
jgi:hypothetical protein